MARLETPDKVARRLIAPNIHEHFLCRRKKATRRPYFTAAVRPGTINADVEVKKRDARNRELPSHVNTSTIRRLRLIKQPWNFKLRGIITSEIDPRISDNYVPSRNWKNIITLSNNRRLYLVSRKTAMPKRVSTWMSHSSPHQSLLRRIFIIIRLVAGSTDCPTVISCKWHCRTVFSKRIPIQDQNHYPPTIIAAKIALGE